MDKFSVPPNALGLLADAPYPVPGTHLAIVGDFELLARWEQWLRGRGLSEHTIRLYGIGVFRLHREFVKDSPRQAREEHVTAFLASLGGHGVARVQYLRGCRSFFKFALKRGEVDLDPTSDIEVRKPSRKQPVALEEDELLRFFLAAASRDERRAWTLMLAFGLGGRRMEVASIRPSDVNGSRVHLTNCKYGKERWVELSDYALAALDGLRPWYNGTVLGGVKKAQITEWAHQAAVDSGLMGKVANRPAHVLRASFITHLLNQGVPVQVVRDLAGHENIATTNTYAATAPHQRAEAVARLRF